MQLCKKSRTNFTEKNKVHHGTCTSKLICSQFFKGICICSHQFSETFPTQKNKYTPFLFSQNEKDPNNSMIISNELFILTLPLLFHWVSFFSTFSKPIQNIYDQLYIQNTATHTFIYSFYFLLNLAQCICDWNHLIKIANMAGIDDLFTVKSVDLQTEILFDLSQRINCLPAKWDTWVRSPSW